MTIDWRILAAITVITWGSYTIILKKIDTLIPWQVSMLMFIVSYAVIVIGFCLTDKIVTISAITKKESAWALLAGLICGLGAITFFKAIPLAPGSILMPLAGLSSMVSALGCIFFLGEPISIRIGLGIVFAGVAIILLAR